MQIPECPDYSYVNGEVHNNRLGTVLKGSYQRGFKLYTLYNYERKRTQIRLSTLVALSGVKLDLPKSAKQIAHCSNYWIDHDGNVYSFSRSNRGGKKLKPLTSSNGYAFVHIKYKGVRRCVSIQKLMGETFIHPGYAEKGLVCMHADNDKTNNKLSNLSVGTHAKNIQDAYATGANTRRRKNKVST